MTFSKSLINLREKFVENQHQAESGFTCLKPKLETLELCIKYVQS